MTLGSKRVRKLSTIHFAVSKYHKDAELETSICCSFYSTAKRLGILACPCQGLLNFEQKVLRYNVKKAPTIK